MPIVRAYVRPRFTAQSLFNDKNLSNLILLRHACEEVIPAGMSTRQEPLNPGSIQFIATEVDDGLKTDVFIDVQTTYQEDLWANPDEEYVSLSERTDAMKSALNEIFPDVTFAFWVTLLEGVYVTDNDDEEPFEGDMSMKAALRRYELTTGHRIWDPV